MPLAIRGYFFGLLGQHKSRSAGLTENVFGQYGINMAAGAAVDHVKPGLTIPGAFVGFPTDNMFDAAYVATWAAGFNVVQCS